MPITEPGGPQSHAETHHTIWNRRNLAVIDQIYSPNVLVQASAGRIYHGTGQLRSFILSMLAMFSDLHLTVDDAYWMGNSAEGTLVAIR